VKHLKVFGKIVFVHKPKEERPKLDSKNIQDFFVGYEGKFNQVWIMSKRRLCINRNVLVVESLSFQVVNTIIKDFSKINNDNDD
jgi:hypothetical protein